MPDEGIDLKRPKVIPIAHIEAVQEVPVVMTEQVFGPIVFRATDDEAFGPIVHPGARLKFPKIEQIQRIVAEYFGLTLAEMISQQRARHIARPRQVAMFLCRQFTPRSMPEIGRRFGDRDHTTVLSAVRRIELVRAADKTLNAEIIELEKLIRAIPGTVLAV